MIHLKRFGVGLLWGAAVVLLAFLLVKFTLIIGGVMFLILIYLAGMGLYK